MKKVILILAFVALLVTVAGPAQAALEWFPATLTYAGSVTYVDETLYISAVSTYGAWTGSRWFVVTGSDYKVQLAIALSAWSTGAPISILLDNSSIAEWSPCYGLLAAPSQ